MARLECNQEDIDNVFVGTMPLCVRWEALQGCKLDEELVDLLSAPESVQQMEMHRWTEIFELVQRENDCWLKPGSSSGSANHRELECTLCMNQATLQHIATDECARNRCTARVVLSPLLKVLVSAFRERENKTAKSHPKPTSAAQSKAPKKAQLELGRGYSTHQIHAPMNESIRDFGGHYSEAAYFAAFDNTGGSYWQSPASPPEIPSLIDPYVIQNLTHQEIKRLHDELVEFVYSTLSTGFQHPYISARFVSEVLGEAHTAHLTVADVAVLFKYVASYISYLVHDPADY